MPASKTTLSERYLLLFSGQRSVREALETLKGTHGTWTGVQEATSLNHVTVQRLRERHWPESLGEAA